MSDQVTGLLSPFLRNRRLAAIRPFLAAGPVLDVGCGTGQLARFIQPEHYLGIDVDTPSVDEARRLWPQHQFQVLTDFEQSPPTEGFDVIVALAVIEHIPQPATWLREFRSLLRPGGRILLTTPHPYFGWIHSLGASVGIFSREAAEEHQDLIGKRRMQEIATAAGLRIVEQRRFLCGANQLFVLQEEAPQADPDQVATHTDVNVEAPPGRPGPAQASRWVNRIGSGLAIAAGVAVLWPIMSQGGALWQNARWSALVGAVAVGAVVYSTLTALLGLAWWWLLGAYGRRPDWVSGVAIWARTQIAKYLPGNVFHYVGRHALGRGAGVGHTALAGAAVLELVSLLLAALLVQAGSVAQARHSQSLSLPAATMLVLVAAVGWPLVDSLLRRIPFIRTRMEGFVTLSLTRRMLLLGPTMLLHVAFLLGTGAILSGLSRAAWPELNVYWTDVIWVYALAWMAGTVTPGAPGGAGVREAVLTALLSERLGAAHAATAAVALRLVTVVGDILTAGWGWLLPVSAAAAPNQLVPVDLRMRIETLPSEPS